MPLGALGGIALLGAGLWTTGWTAPGALSPPSVAVGAALFKADHPKAGPLLNAAACSACHAGGGRGDAPAASGPLPAAVVLRLSAPARRRTGEPAPDVRYGDQLQPLSHHPHHPGLGLGEGRVDVVYRPVEGRYADGTPYTLRAPVYRVRGLAHGPLGEGVTFSVRSAPAVVGLGALQAIPATELAARADPFDADGDGISGRINWVWDILEARHAPGRFGHKGEMPSLVQQIAGALWSDMGVTSPLFPWPVCTAVQGDCLARVDFAVLDADGGQLAALEAFHLALPPPARRGYPQDPEVRRGAELFEGLNCSTCHTPRQRVGPIRPSPLASGLQRTGRGAVPRPPGGIIWPYTDLLLHDMGGDCDPVVQEGDAWVQRCTGLADGRVVFDASGREWRTPPLWGLGWAKALNPEMGYLHDGRARTLEEAILWHGGEGAAAREGFRQLTAAQRRALLRFLASL